MSRSVKMRGNTNGRGNKGRIFKPETLEKMSKAKLGKAFFKGRKHSKDSRKKMSLSRRENLKKANPDYDYRLDSRTREGNKRIRRERIKRFGGSHTLGEWETLKAQYDWTCPKCKGREPTLKLTRDHVIPLANGGSDNIENIQPLCNPCNAKKNTQTIRY